MEDVKLPKGWVETIVGEIGLVVTGNTPKKSIVGNYDGDIPFYKPTDLNQGYKTEYAKSLITEKGLSSTRELPALSVLVTCIGATIGKTGLIRKRGASNQQINAIVPNNSISPKFVYFQCISSNFKQNLIKNSSSTTLPIINKSRFSNLLFLLPPLAEQKRMVAKLDKLFGHLERLQGRLVVIPGLLKDFRQSVLTQAVTGKLTEEWREGKELEKFDVVKLCEEKHWNPKALSKYKTELENIDFGDKLIPKSWIKTTPGIVCKKIVDGTHKTPKYQSEGVPFLSAKNIKQWKIDYDKCKYISKTEHEQLTQRCNPEKGSLLITKSGTIGRMAILDFIPDFSLFESVAVLTPLNNLVSAKLLGYAINVYLKSGGTEKHVKGTAVQHLHLNEIRTLPILLPSPTEQTEIVTRVQSLFTKVDRISARYEALKEKMEQLPQAILAKAFRGELTEQLETDGDARDLLEEIAELRASMVKKKKTKKKK